MGSSPLGSPDPRSKRCNSRAGFARRYLRMARVIERQLPAGSDVKIAETVKARVFKKDDRDAPIRAADRLRLPHCPPRVRCRALAAAARPQPGPDRLRVCGRSLGDTARGG